MKNNIISLSLVLLGSVNSVFAAVAVDKNIPTYTKSSGISGNISSIGSDTLANLMTLWAEKFSSNYPSVNIQIQASGSSTAPPALTEATANFGPMSRQMKDKEIQSFEKRHGYKPTAIPVAIDALAVFVHKDNPIKGMNLAQVDAIFSITRKCGYKEVIDTWGKIGLTGSWQSRTVQLFGRNSVSGTYGFFKKKALCKGDYRNAVNEQPGSASVVQSVSTSIRAIGYSGIGYQVASVRALPLAKKGTHYIAPTAKNAISGKYPLARFLYVYLNKKPGTPLVPLEREFIKMILSREGQQIVVKDGYIPLSSKMIAKTRKKLGL